MAFCTSPTDLLKKIALKTLTCKCCWLLSRIRSTKWYKLCN